MSYYTNIDMCVIISSFTFDFLCTKSLRKICYDSFLLLFLQSNHIKMNEKRKKNVKGIPIGKNGCDVASYHGSSYLSIHSYCFILHALFPTIYFNSYKD